VRSIQEMIRLPVGGSALFRAAVSEIVATEKTVTTRNSDQILNPGGSLMVRFLCATRPEPHPGGPSGRRGRSGSSPRTTQGTTTHRPAEPAAPRWARQDSREETKGEPPWPGGTRPGTCGLLPGGRVLESRSGRSWRARSEAVRHDRLLVTSAGATGHCLAHCSRPASSLSPELDR